MEMDKESMNSGSIPAEIQTLSMDGLLESDSLDNKAMEIKQSFAPIEGNETRILILGSKPGDASIAAGRCYAHPRNCFWPLMASLLGCVLPVDYEARCRMLQEHGICFDVLQ